MLLAALVAAPVLLGMGYALLASLGLVGAGAEGVPSGQRLAAVLGARSTWRSLAWTLYVSASATTLATAGAVGVAIGLPSRGRIGRLTRALAVLPLPVPHLVAAATALLLFAQSGLFARLLFSVGLIAEPAAMPALVYDQAGIALIATLAWKELPFLTVVALALRTGADPALDEAARSLGASPAAVRRHVQWPMLWRGLLPAVIAVFVFALGSFETAVLLAPVDPAPLAVLTMERFADPALARRGEAWVLALLAFALSALAVVAHEWARARWSATARRAA